MANDEVQSTLTMKDLEKAIRYIFLQKRNK